MMYEQLTPAELKEKKEVPANVFHFKELPPDMQADLVEFIGLRFRKTQTYNSYKSAYGMKQEFSRFYEWRKGRTEHVTSRCFKEAMEYCGYQVRPVPEHGRECWQFNAAYRRHRGKHYVRWSPETADLFFPGWSKKLTPQH